MTKLFLVSLVFLLSILQTFGLSAETCEKGDTCYVQFKKLHKYAHFGSPDAQIMLGVMYANGENVEQDHERARYWFTKAAKPTNSNAFAQYELSKIYLKGIGTEQDIEKGNYWLQKAAKNGSSKARLILALKLHLGENFERDDSKAKEWLLLASEQGNTTAAYYLALFAEKGLGGPIDEELALEMYKLAAADNVKDARSHYMRLSPEINKVADSQVDSPSTPDYGDDENKVIVIRSKLEVTQLLIERIRQQKLFNKAPTGTRIAGNFAGPYPVTVIRSTTDIDNILSQGTVVYE